MRKVISSLAIILTLSLTFACGGGGGESGGGVSQTDESNKKDGVSRVYSSEITDPNNPFVAVAVDETGAETIGVGAQKDADGNILALTFITYSNLKDNSSVTIALGDNGLPAASIDSAGNKLTYDNYTANSVEIRAYDSSGALVSGPTAVTINKNDLKPLQEASQIFRTGRQRSLYRISSYYDGNLSANDTIGAPYLYKFAISDYINKDVLLEAASISMNGVGCVGSIVTTLGWGTVWGCKGLIIDFASNLVEFLDPQLMYKWTEIKQALDTYGALEGCVGTITNSSTVIGYLTSGNPNLILLHIKEITAFINGSFHCIKGNSDAVKMASQSATVSGDGGGAGGSPATGATPTPPQISSPLVATVNQPVTIKIKKGDQESGKIQCTVTGSQYVATPFETAYGTGITDESFTVTFNATGSQIISCLTINTAEQKSFSVSRVITVSDPNAPGGTQQSLSPSNFNMTATAYCNTQPPAGPAIKLNWDVSARATAYDIYRNDTKYAEGINGTSYDNNANVISGQTYTYYIIAKNSLYITRSLNSVTVTVPADVCSGNGSVGSTASQITVGPGSLDLGNVDAGACSTATVAIQHVSGTDPASGNVNVSPDPPFSISSGASFSVSNGETHNVEIKFCPTSSGSYSGKVTVTSDASFTGTNTVTLTGTGGAGGGAASVSLSSPSDGGVFNQGDSISFTGSAYDTEDGNLSGASLVWTSSVNGQIGTGSSFTKSNLSAGTHTIILTATDSSGTVATKSISITIKPTGNLTLSASQECAGGPNTPQIRLSWSGLTQSVSKFEIYRNNSLIYWTGSQSATSYLNTDVSSGATYNYMVRGVTPGGNFDSNSVNITAPTCQTTLPPGPFTLSVTPMCNGNTPRNYVDWTFVANVDPMFFPYEVYRNDSKIGTSTSGNGYFDDSVTPGATYDYFMRAMNEAGSRDSNIIHVTTRSDCAAPVAPSISSINPSSVTVGNGSFALNIYGQNFNQQSVIQCNGSPCFFGSYANSSTLSVNISQGSYGYDYFALGQTSISVAQLQSNGSYAYPSNSVVFNLYNPVPVINSITGTCKAGFNCVPANGYDVRINGSGFVGTGAGSSKLYFNGTQIGLGWLGGGPVSNQLQLTINGSMIPTAGTYSVQVCNSGTASGTACSTGSLTVIP